jgi:hypothetical protein
MVAYTNRSSASSARSSRGPSVGRLITTDTITEPDISNGSR